MKEKNIEITLITIIHTTLHAVYKSIKIVEQYADKLHIQKLAVTLFKGYFHIQLQTLMFERQNAVFFTSSCPCDSSFFGVGWVGE